MFCLNCGAVINDGLGFCPNCGAPVTQNPPQQPNYNQPTYQQPDPYSQPQVNYGQPTYQQPDPYSQPQATYSQPQQVYYNQPNSQPQMGVNESLATLILVFGIVSLGCSWFPFFSIVGIVFGAIAMTKGKNYVRNNPMALAKGKVGRGLAIGGFVNSIVFTVYYLSSCVENL